MIIHSDKYFERIRSNRTFFVTLILGIIGAGIVTLFIEYLPDEIKKSILMPIGLFIALIIVLILAIYISQKLENVIVRYLVSIDPEFFITCTETIMQTIPPEAKYRKELEQILQNMNNIFENLEVCENSNITHLQPYFTQLHKLRGQIRERSIIEILGKIHEANTDIKTLNTLLKESSNNKVTMIKGDYQIKTIENGIVLQKICWKIYKKEVLRFTFESYSEKSLLYPVYCHTEMSPFLSMKEYNSLIDRVNQLFELISAEKKFLELGIRFDLEEDIRYKNHIRRDIYTPLHNEINRSTDRILTGFLPPSSPNTD